VTAFFDMLGSGSCLRAFHVGGELGCNVRIIETETLLLSLVVLPMGANRTAVEASCQEWVLQRFIELASQKEIWPNGLKKERRFRIKLRLP
jgi:hypothetical protein